VKVHVLLDWVGSAKLDEHDVELMKQAGVQVERYHKPEWTHPSRLNNRTHRKLLIVDGSVGFTGGVGIADKWRGDAQDADHWRDTHFRAEGRWWHRCRRCSTTTGSRRPAACSTATPTFRHCSRAAASRRRCSAARRRRQREHAPDVPAGDHRGDAQHRPVERYFVPGRADDARAGRRDGRGVKVRIIVPGRHRFGRVRRRLARRLGPLLAAGVEIAEYQPTMFHCKVLVVDGCWCRSARPTSTTARSPQRRGQPEPLDEQFAREQVTVFEHDLSRSKVVTLEAWRNRPKKERRWSGSVSC
jgi:cardiolipin synthase